MGMEVYVKIDQHVKVNKKKLLLSDIASVHCGKHDLTKELSDIMVFQVPGNESGMYAMTFIKIVELIHRKRQDVTVVNEGEKDFIIEYMPEKKKKNAWEYTKVAFVCLVAFFGAAFTIMTFNMDVSVDELFNKIYAWMMGYDKGKQTSVLELSYCAGLPIGILVFFNHFSKKKLTTDPTPIHVEMRNYETEINTAIIEDSSREGKTIDVS